MRLFDFSNYVQVGELASLCVVAENFKSTPFTKVRLTYLCVSYMVEGAEFPCVASGAPSPNPVAS